MNNESFEVPSIKPETQNIESVGVVVVNEDSVGNNNNLELPTPKATKERFEKIPLTEDELKMSNVELAQKYNLSYWGAWEMKRRGYSVLNGYKSQLSNTDPSKTNSLDSQFIRIQLSDEEMKLSAKELSEKYNVSIKSGYNIKEKGFVSIPNNEYKSKESIDLEKRKQTEEFLKEITPIEANSIETILGNPKEQELIKAIVDQYNTYKYYDKYKISEKKFKLLNGEELSFGDIVILNKLVELRVFRDKNGQLMMFHNNKFIPFRPAYFFSDNRQSFIFKGDLNTNEDKRTKSLEYFSPNIYKRGIFKEEDFNRRQFGSSAYEINGPHERKLSESTPNVFLSNSTTSAKYYLGRDKFVGTNKKINHDTVRVSLLDENTGVVTDTINGRKLILYTFPLVSKEEYERQKREIIDRRISKNKTTDINANNYTTMKAELKEYSIRNYIPKNLNELEEEYTDKISRLSDTSYVLGNFKSFISETGLAANNYSWREQLILADTLTRVESKEKILNFGKNFGKNGLRTFLSIEQEVKEGGKEMGDKILALGDSEKFPEDIARKVFAKYGEIINTVDNTEEEIKKIFGQNDIPERVLNSVKETLLKRGAKMLSLLGDKVLDPKFEVNETEILKELDEIKEETIILGQSYVGLYKEGIKVPIEDVTTIKETSTKDLTDERKEELMKIYEKGRPKVTYDKQSHLEFLKEEFRNELNDKDISVTEICFKNETIIIALIDKKDEETLHIGGFTFVEDVKNAVIAEATMSYAFEKFKNYNIKALVDSKNPLLNMYLKRFGFRITKKLDSREEIRDNGGEIYYEVEKIKDFRIGEKVEEKEELLEEAA